MYGHLDYDDRVVDTTFTRLFESEMTNRFFFIAKSLKTQKRYLDELENVLNSNVFTLRSNRTSNTISTRVGTVSSSDEDGGDGTENEVDLIG